MQPKEVLDHARELRRLAEQRGANAEQLTWALRQWRRAVIAYAFREKGETIHTPGNVAWRAPTGDALFVHGRNQNLGISQYLIPLIEHGMDHGLADLDLTKDPTVAAAPERRDEPPERMEV